MIYLSQTKIEKFQNDVSVIKVVAGIPIYVLAMWLNVPRISFERVFNVIHWKRQSDPKALQGDNAKKIHDLAYIILEMRDNGYFFGNDYVTILLDAVIFLNQRKTKTPSYERVLNYLHHQKLKRAEDERKRFFS